MKALFFPPIALRPARSAPRLKSFPQGRADARSAPAAIEKWVLRNLGSVGHERRVASIAAKIFDLTWPLHGLGPEERRLLLLGALVHDVGRCIDDETHPQQGARMLLETPRLPLTASERRALAYLTRYHRGKPPQIGMDGILRRHDDRDALRAVLALLRSADALDGRQMESPRLMFSLRERHLQIVCLLENDTPKACKVYSRRKKHRLLEEVLDCRVDVRVMPVGAMRRVA